MFSYYKYIKWLSINIHTGEENHPLVVYDEHVIDFLGILNMKSTLAFVCILQWADFLNRTQNPHAATYASIL